jgi:hypothetical protein
MNLYYMCGIYLYTDGIYLYADGIYLYIPCIEKDENIGS